MSHQITEAQVKQYSANWFHLSQQKGSRFAPYVRNESVKGVSKFFDRIGSVAAVLKTSRHSDTPQIDTPHSRRMVTMSDYEWADLIDDQDLLRTLIDPKSPYVEAAMWAMGRSKDAIIRDAALGSAYSGVDGGTAVVLPDSQKLGATDGTTAGGTNLNVFTLRLLKKKFDANDIDESIPRYIAVTSSQLYSLLGETQVTSADYNMVKALVQGDIDTFMGFKFIRYESLGTLAANTSFTVADGTWNAGAGTYVAGARRCFAWAQDGIVMGVGQDVVSRISERDDKSYSTQVYARMSLGATRLEEVKVVEVICKES